MGLLGTFDNFLIISSLERFLPEVVCQKRQQNNIENEGALAEHWSLLLAWMTGVRSSLLRQKCSARLFVDVSPIWRNGQKKFGKMKKSVLWRDFQAQKVMKLNSGEIVDQVMSKFLRIPQYFRKKQMIITRSKRSTLWQRLPGNKNSNWRRHPFLQRDSVWKALNEAITCCGSRTI